MKLIKKNKLKQGVNERETEFADRVYEYCRDEMKEHIRKKYNKVLFL